MDLVFRTLIGDYGLYKNQRRAREERVRMRNGEYPENEREYLLLHEQMTTRQTSSE